jgi:3-oxoacyl-[acyl-carrier-protein] synthase III
MTLPSRAAILGTGCYVPERVLSNADLERMVDTSDQWIVERTGIRERRIAGPDETTSTMATIAARRACEDASLAPDEIDLILVATVTPDFITPSAACLVQHAIGATRAGAVDLNAACSGFIYTLSIGAGMVSSGMHRHVLVIGSETLSRITDYQDRGTCILFGDGAGAVVLGPANDGRGLIHSRLRSDGEHFELLQVPGGGSKYPCSLETLSGRKHYLHVAGRQVFRFATGAFIELIRDAMETCGLTHDEIKLVIPHQVNERIIDAAMKRIDIPREKCFINIDRYGNTSSASIPIALDEARRTGRLTRGDLAILVGFGAGLTWASAVVRM